jgi:hypothetical protein
MDKDFEQFNFLFQKSKCQKSLGYLTDYYHDMCEDSGISPMSVENMISFVEEANGSRTIYDLNTNKIYLFSHDHCYDYLTFLPDQPEYTFHYIENINSFTEYAETLALQWSSHVIDR